MKKSKAALLLTSEIPLLPIAEECEQVALDMMFCATKLYNGYRHESVKKQLRYKWAFPPADLPFLNKATKKLPRAQALHSLVAQGVRDEYHEAVESHMALIHNGRTQHNAPKPRAKEKFTALTYVMGNGCHIEDGFLRLSCGLHRKDRVREIQFYVHIHPGVVPFTKIQTVTLVYDTTTGQFSARLTGIPPMEEPFGNTVTPRKASIDLGMKYMAALRIEAGPHYLLSAGLLRSTQHYWMKVRQHLKAPAETTKGSERWYAVRRQEAQQVDHLLHIMSLDIVRTLWKHGVTVLSIGDLTGITEDKNWGRVGNKYLHAWPFATFVRYLKYKCKRQGITVVDTDERGTSRTCHRCKKVDVRQRTSRGRYQCSCGYEQHADLNGADNIFETAFGHSPVCTRISPWSIGAVAAPAVVPLVQTRHDMVKPRSTMPVGLVGCPGF